MSVDFSIVPKVSYRILFMANASLVILYTLPFFITLKGVGWAFQCANKLLEDGVIDYIAFFTESEKTVSMARALISSGYKDKLIVPGKSYVNDTENHIDSMDMRDPDEMETAVSEWLCKIDVY